VLLVFAIPGHCLDILGVIRHMIDREIWIPEFRIDRKLEGVNSDRNPHVHLADPSTGLAVDSLNCSSAGSCVSGFSLPSDTCSTAALSVVGRFVASIVGGLDDENAFFSDSWYA
jgi:hypothetical protein